MRPRLKAGSAHRRTVTQRRLPAPFHVQVFSRGAKDKHADEGSVAYDDGEDIEPEDEGLEEEAPQSRYNAVRKKYAEGGGQGSGSRAGSSAHRY